MALVVLTVRVESWLKDRVLKLAKRRPRPGGRPDTSGVVTELLEAGLRTKGARK